MQGLSGAVVDLRPLEGEMQQTKYTPGPWSYSHRKDKYDESYSTEVYDSAGETIATLAWYPVKRADGSTATAREANARLVAAAPDLLAALLVARTLFMEVKQRGALGDAGLTNLATIDVAIAKASSR